MYPMENPPCYMLHLLFCGRDDACNEIVHMYLEEISQWAFFPWFAVTVALFASAQCANLCAGRAPSCVLIYSTAKSLAVSDAAQKYGADSTQPICSELGTTRCRGSPGSCGQMKQKFHSSHSRQLSLQKPSWTSHFAIRTTASSSTSANA
jgi:hypothetical protein